jgi:hypothetical protein
VGAGAGSTGDAATTTPVAVGARSDVAAAGGAAGVAVLQAVATGTGAYVDVAGCEPTAVAVTSTVVLAGPANALGPALQPASTTAATSNAMHVGVPCATDFFMVTTRPFIPVHCFAIAACPVGSLQRRRQSVRALTVWGAPIRPRRDPGVLVAENRRLSVL